MVEIDPTTARNVIVILKTFIKVLENKALQNKENTSSGSDISSSSEEELKNTNKCKVVVTLEPDGIQKNIFIEKNLKIRDLHEKISRSFRVSREEI